MSGWTDQKAVGCSWVRSPISTGWDQKWQSQAALAEHEACQPYWFRPKAVALSTRSWGYILPGGSAGGQRRRAVARVKLRDVHPHPSPGLMQSLLCQQHPIKTNDSPLEPMWVTFMNLRIRSFVYTWGAISDPQIKRTQVINAVFTSRKNHFLGGRNHDSTTPGKCIWWCDMVMISGVFVFKPAIKWLYPKEWIQNWEEIRT